MKLSLDEVDIIRRQVAQSSISIESLRDDILDHLCCVVEIKIERGKTFNAAMEEAFQELAPDGLDEIQRETVFLLNSIKIIAMKQVMYFIGLLSAMSFVLGWMFGLLRWPGGTSLSIYGFLGFVFVFVPLLAVDRYKTNLRWLLSDKLKFTLGLLSGLIVAAAVLMKLMHLTGADLFLILGTGLFVFGFLPFLFFTMYKKSIS
jgi:hypothetical protein